MMPVPSYKIGIIGLGYVGLPLAMAFAEKYNTVGYDIDTERVKQLLDGVDKTRQVSTTDLQGLLQSNSLKYTTERSELKNCNIYIITVPTPVDADKNPDLSFLIAASEMVGGLLKEGDIVIYESTVYPGCTEEVCVPALEKKSRLIFNQGFYCGYSPERINPGDKERKLTDIVKVTSGSTPAIGEIVNSLYESVINAGTHLASSIKIAEAAKAIENAQRDINISFMNELALIFDKLEISTQEVLEAAGTKWNFLPFRPGLVGGHCIGVDPYYLAYKAKQVGYTPDVILSGRKINDQMGFFVANKLMKAFIDRNIPLQAASVLILGITFKENCPDIRNTKVVDIYMQLQANGIALTVFDPYADPLEVKEELGIDLAEGYEGQYDGIIVAVGHDEFKLIDISKLKKTAVSVLFDVKNIFCRENKDLVL